MGFDFIEEPCPKTSEGTAQLRWVTKQQNDSDSPIYNFPPALVEKAIKVLMSQPNTSPLKSADPPRVEASRVRLLRLKDSKIYDL